MRISVFGSGYVGLVQAAVLAEVGHDVVCMDIDEKKVEMLQQGHVSIFEPGLASLALFLSSAVFLFMALGYLALFFALWVLPVLKRDRTDAVHAAA